MSIGDKQAGISCPNCGHEVVVETEAERKKLENKIYWDEGDPTCPECSHRVWFENYLD